jgi:cyanophycinase-like exopeptidase
MVQAPGCRVLAIMGSGETSPTMVAVHKALVARLGTVRAAVLLEAPYGFQENAADVSARAQAYFARSVGLAVTVVAGTAAPGGDPADDGGAAVVRAADWVFAGPGSPSYALARWRDRPVAQALRDRIGAGQGVTVLASAAAATMGFAAVPVYEIYKAGAAPHWLDGLDLLSVLGLKVAVIPHYDNAEGGNHDTRYCYLGERRLSLLEQDLPADAAVLGVDEHTAAIFDARAGTLEISGRGCVTVRKAGASVALPSGASVTLARLRGLVRRGPRPSGDDLPRVPAVSPSGTPPLALTEIVRAAERRFELAAGQREAPGMVQAILDLEAAIHSWAGDTDEDQGTEQARVVLRGLVDRLGRAAREGLRDPRARLLPAVEPLMTARDALRDSGCYAAADAIRDALTAAGLVIQDTLEGTRWAPPPARAEPP